MTSISRRLKPLIFALGLLSGSLACAMPTVMYSGSVAVVADAACPPGPAAQREVVPNRQRHASIYKDEKFSDHAPLTIGYDFTI